MKPSGRWAWQQYLGYNTKALTTKSELDKQDYTELKTIYLGKQSIDKVKTQPAEWEETRANHTYGAGIQKRQREFLQLNGETPDNPVTMHHISLKICTWPTVL